MERVTHSLIFNGSVGCNQALGENLSTEYPAMGHELAWSDEDIFFCSCTMGALKIKGKEEFFERIFWNRNLIHCQISLSTFDSGVSR